MRNLFIVTLATLFLVTCCATTLTDFIQKAAMSDMYEVEAGKIAGQKGQSDAVKNFGQMMVDAHSKTTEELKSLVASEAIKVGLPAKFDAKYDKLIDDLNAASNADFDKTYAGQQVDGHKDAVSLLIPMPRKATMPP